VALAGIVNRPLALRRVLAVLLVTSVGQVGCTPDPYVAVSDWTLRTADGIEHQVHAPQRLSELLPRVPTTYFLEADVHLPEILRGRALTLTWPGVLCFATLLLDGEEVPPLGLTAFDSVRPSRQELVFPLPSSKTGSEVLRIRLRVRHFATWSGRTGLPARLSPSPSGERQLHLASDINYVVLVATDGIFFVFAFASALSFLLDRRRVADGWYALMTLGLAVSYLVGIGLSQFLVPHDIPRIPLFTVPLVCVAATRFSAAQFGTSRPPALWTAAFLIVSLVALVSGWERFMNPARYFGLIFLQIALVAACQVVTVGPRVREPQHRFQALGNLGSTLLLAGAGVLQVRPHLIEPFPPMSLLCALVQGALLLRLHAARLRGLRVALEERIVALEQRNDEVRDLNEELRLQIRDRSVQLARVAGSIGRLPTADMTELPPGFIVGGRYKLVRRVGAGGMGVVYEAERLKDGKRFALKTLLAVESGRDIARMAREAYAGATIDHENVVRVFDVDVDDSGVPYVVMAFVDGEPLSARRAQYGDATFAREVLRQAATGLSALHSAGIVHRDLKPSNLLLEGHVREAFRVKIVDFGIARIARKPPPAARPGVLETGGFMSFVRGPGGGTSHAGAARREATWRDLTSTGRILGTPFYMAPELALGARDAAPSSDLWSLGVIAYQLGSGELPFDEWCLDVQRVPASLRDLVVRCLDRDPTRRPTAAEMVGELS
jgi:hypothetical protein